MRAILLLPLLLPLLAPGGAGLWGARAQEPGAPAEDLPEIEEGTSLLGRGDYERALALFERILAKEPGEGEAAAGKARALIAVGRYEEAGDFLAQAPPSGPLRRLLGDARAALGRIEEAEAAYRSAEPSDLLAQERLAALFESVGRVEEARAVRGSIAKAAGRIEGAAGLLALGRALAAIGREEEASEALVEALRLDPDLLDGYAALGELYFRVYRDAQGSPSPVEEFQRALRKNPRHFDALLGCFRVYRANFARDGSKTEGFLRKCLEVNPRAVEALVDQASFRIQDRRFEEARASLAAARAVNPRHRRARVQAAALDRIEGRAAEHAREAAALAAESPGSGDLPASAGANLIDLYRFAEAVPLLREAVRVEPGRAEAWTDLGRALANTGAEKEAVEALAKAEEIERGFVHPWRKNMLAVLERLERTYVRSASPPFALRLHPDEAPVLGALLPPLLHEALEDLSERYGFRPSGEVLLEYFHEYGDFSVRTVGFTGFGALGVCFGPVVTAVSPLAPEVRGRFSWEATTWHEFAHVITIGLSRGRVPRWLTEGLSVLEEKRRDPSFDRGMELELLNARANGEIFPIEELNGAFRTPRILFGYYQGGLVCEWLEENYPFERLPRMLRLYGEDRGTREILKECFDLSPEEFDRRFLAFVDARLEKVAVEPFRDEAGLARLRARVREAPEDLDAAVSLAWEQMRRKNTVDAEERLRRVRARAPGHPRAHLLAAELAFLRGRSDAARAEYEAGFAAGAEEFFARVHHAKLLEAAKDFDGAIEAWRAAKAAFPRYAADPALSPHLALERLLAGAGRGEDARAELEEFAGLGLHSADPFLRLAAYAEGRDDAAESARWLRKAIGVDPFRRELHVRRARALRSLRSLDDAVRSLAAARAVRPALEPGARGEPDAAAEAREQGALFREEAEIHLERGDRAAAAEAARRALALDATDARAAEILERSARPSSG